MSRTATYKAGGTYITDGQNFGAVSWSNTGNASSSDGTYATAALFDNTSELLVAKNFSWNLGSEAIIEGVTVRIEKSSSVNAKCADDYVTLINADGTAEGNNKAEAGQWSDTDTTSTYGGTTDTWGLTLSGLDVDDPDFGVGIAANGTSDGTFGPTAQIDYMEMQLTYHYAYVPASSGGALGGGASDSGVFFAPVISGGALGGGGAALSLQVLEVGDGGALVGGSATATKTLPLFEGAGGALVGGIAVEDLILSPTVSGGGLVGGTAAVGGSSGVVGSGGGLVGGTAAAYGTTSAIGSGGALVGGTARVTGSDAYYPEGGVLAGGGAHIYGTQTIPVGGGALAGGAASFGQVQTPTISGGALAGGTADVLLFYLGIGGALAGGGATEILGYIGQGGANLGGVAGTTFIDFYDGTGGAVAGGKSVVTSKKVFKGVPTGGVVASNEVGNGTFATYHYNAFGGVSVDNSLDPSIINHRFEKDVDFLWRLRAFVFNDITFLWNTGQLGIYFYRVIGKGRQGDECNLKADPCCQKYIMNIQARTIAELCEKISERKFILPIESVQRFARPAALGNIFDDFDAQQNLIEEFDEENGDCNELIPVEICDVPQCADFCVDFDLVVSTNFDIIKLQVNAAPVFESGGGLSAQRTIYTAGTAKVVFDPNLPAFSFEASGLGQDSTAETPRAGVLMSGSAVVATDSYTGRGGVVVGGGPVPVGFSGWVYVGGVWPETASSYPREYEVVNDLEGESNPAGVAWQLPERALVSDDVYTEADISFGNESEYLVLRKFNNIHVPDGGLVFGLLAYIHRYSTQVTTRDSSVKLVVGNTVISDNDLAKTGVDWPVWFETTSVYGSNGLEDGETPFVDEILTAEEVNDTNLGIALRVSDEAVGGGTTVLARVDTMELQAIWEFADKGKIRIGGSSKIVSSSHSYVGSGGIEISGGNAGIKANYVFKSLGLGQGQPTAFVIGGNYFTRFYYESDDVSLAWENDSTIDLGNTGAVAYWPVESENQGLWELLGGFPVANAEWQTPERATLADAVTTTSPHYAQVDLGGVDKASEFLVVRDWNLNLADHFRIHGIRVIVANRFAQNIPNPGVTDVRDTYVYLVNGDTIRSNNLAKTDTWHEFPNSVIYGSTGFDGSAEWRDLEADPLTPDEVNNPNFGVAIAVSNFDTTADTFAKIDGIAMEFTIEAFGRIQVEVTEPKIGGEADAFPSFTDYNGSGGATIGGGARIVPFWESFNGGLLVNPALDPLEELLNIPREKVIYNHVVSGGVDVGGESDVPVGVFGYTATGGVDMGGEAGRAKNVWTYDVDPSFAIFVGGSADYVSGDLGDQITTMKFSMTILQTTASFAEDEDLQDAELLTDLVSQCGCTQIPLTVEFGHNFARDNIFSKFLIRNNFTISRKLFLRYNVSNDSWQDNLHYRGLSADANTEEKWDIVFELQCTDAMGGINIGRKIWKLSMGVQRKNLTTQEDFDTRVIIGILPEALCDVNANELDFEVNYNTLLDVADVNPEATIYQNSIFDNIGLFRNRGWTETPDLIFSISQSGLQEDQERVDLTNPVLHPADANRININNL